MNGEENIDKISKRIDTPDDVNENTSLEQAIEQSKTQSENMEVHAQELHKAPGNGLKHYLFEFLMLFLAVFCGFLAENFREHIVEQKRTKLYAQQFYDELKLDTASLDRFIIYSGAVYKKYDTIVKILSAGVLDDVSLTCTQTRTHNMGLQVKWGFLL
jgi:hypothetical protein